MESGMQECVRKMRESESLFDAMRTKTRESESLVDAMRTP